ncbi:MAG: CvpA family protein [Chloroflexi bacterium]|nr:CvpA family protein [Chloroflexota bacterium]OJV99906.1 MAG: hypothetical protein BGO39_29525 [Chloroflexi bacterium 54-19]
MTFVDIFIFLGMMALLYFCFVQGILKVVTVLLGMYAGLQVSAVFYKIFADITANKSDPNSITTNQVVWFFALWIVWSIIFSLVAWSFIRHLDLPKWAVNLDQVGGLVIGLLAVIFFFTIFGYVFKNIATLLWYGSGRPTNWLLTVKEGFDTSFFMKLFATFKALFVEILSPWLPSRDLPVFKDNL